jgi:hypothetical protein
MAACCISKINDANAKILNATLMVFMDTGTENRSLGVLTARGHLGTDA